MKRFSSVQIYEFITTVPVVWNWCPSDLMYQHAKATPGVYFERNRYFTATLIVEGVRFYFDHYTIKNNGNGTETVTVTLNRKEAA